MESLNLLHLSSREKEILEYIAFKFVKYDKNSYSGYGYGYSYGYDYSYGYGRKRFSDKELENAFRLFDSYGWFVPIYDYSKKGELDRGGLYLHPIIWLDLLKRSKNSQYLKLQSSWGDYDIKTMRSLLGEKKDSYPFAAAHCLEYESKIPLATYLMWSFFTEGWGRDWLQGFEGYDRYELDWQIFQFSYIGKIASANSFLYYRQPEVNTFLQYSSRLLEEEDQAQLEDSFRLNWTFVAIGSAQNALEECHEDTDATSWLLAAGLLRQQDYKKAYQCARSASRQKSWASGYRSALEDLIYGLCLYHNRGTPMADKKIKELNGYFHLLVSQNKGSIGFETSMHACSILLSRLCLKSVTSKEFQVVWNHFVRDVKATDRLIFFGLLIGYLGVEEAITTVESLSSKLPNTTDLIDSELYGIRRHLAEVEGKEPEEPGEEEEKNLYLPIINNIVVKKDYEIAINQLNSLMRGAPKSANARVIYLLDNGWGISLRQQKYGRNGWGAFYSLAFKTFTQGTQFMDDVDRQIAAIMNTPNMPNRELEIIKKLIGSDRVYSLYDPDTRITIEEVKFELSTKTNPDQSYTFVSNIPVLSANLINEIPKNNAVWWNVGNTYYQKDNNVIKICQLSDEQRQMADILLRVPNYPKSVRKDLTQILESVSRTTTVMSDLLKDSENLPVIQGLTQLTIRIEPDEDLFDVKAVLYLAENEEVSHKPGVGLSTIATVVNGKSVKIERDLKKEKENYDKFVAAAEPFSSWQYEDGSWQLELPEMLEMLEVIRQLGDAVRVEWPEGVEYKVTRPVQSFGNFSLNLRGTNFWFDFNGKLKIDKDTELKMGDILDRIREAKGRFIKLEGNEFIALNQKLMKQLKTLEEISSRKGNSRSISRYGVGFLKELEEEGVTIESDGEYEGLIDRIEKASDLVVDIPKTFVGQLRNYQEEGFEWMSKLASWEAGGILADDMGLGKTVQAIALLGAKKQDGPSLVVCPSSVLINWKNELAKFDPSLNVRLFNKEDRKAVLQEAKAGDVVLSTYGVINTESEHVAKVNWNVVILDEAHSIKNKATQISKAVKQIKAKSRFLMTGTPIQNHLGEIWNLFDYANPGLLGSFNSFAERFIYPIQKAKDANGKEAQLRLKKLISPFMLRRTKQEVEQELPPRTEIEMKIPLSKEEQALYDKLRQEAYDDINYNAQNSAISILAHLTKLRQAACHPELVDPKLQIGSSKTDAFLGLAQRLISEGHRALVFSQFTSHLALIRRELDALGIPYLYMDGSFSSTERDKLKKEFQEGSTPLFLISLKAGGIGMNLTAADYVIHLDPWWNPAIEDQASDRAHRIGQEKPVHIYKLIAEGTIEEKILTVHKDKKSLSDALLEGSDLSARFSKQEILDILKDSESFRN
ncbi:MAG: DEAD/DEAH box helicase [Burkholderiales bacterium]|nr:DEAD/DEAH box helicase [Burkholderiales bacterium]